MVIIECGFKHIKSNKITHIEELLKTVISLFITNEDKEIVSYNLWSLTLFTSYS